MDSIEHKWIRKCNECGHKQEDKNPANVPSTAYLNRACKKCKSSGLDWGQWKSTPQQEEE